MEKSLKFIKFYQIKINCLSRITNRNRFYIAPLGKFIFLNNVKGTYLLSLLKLNIILNRIESFVLFRIEHIECDSFQNVLHTNSIIDHQVYEPDLDSDAQTFHAYTHPITSTCSQLYKISS